MLRMPIPARDVKRESNSGTLHIHARGRSLSLSRYPYGGLANANPDAATQIGDVTGEFRWTVGRNSLSSPARRFVCERSIHPTKAKTRAMSRPPPRLQSISSAWRSCSTCSMRTAVNPCWWCCKRSTPPGRTARSGTYFSGMNPQGTCVFGFKQPSKEELAHDFLWRAHLRTPAKGQVVIFNRSHYEDVLVVRVHNLVPQSVWSKRYDLINDFEKMLQRNGTNILKFYLHISPKEQLTRFAQRLDDPARNWKISESDYSERKLWPQYVEAYEEAMALTSRKHAPWYIIPADHKWFRDLAISEIIADTMDEMGLKLPSAQVNIADIRRKYHAAVRNAKAGAKPAAKAAKTGR
jgi:PPK2 family polyphosphate:nucleotide phosphotransferase